MQFNCVKSTAKPATASMSTETLLRPTQATPWRLPAGMRATQATRALALLYEARPDAALSEAEVEAALAVAGVCVNRVTVYRLLDRFAAAGLLHKRVDAARVARYARAPQGGDATAAHFECGDCHRQFRLPQGPASVRAALAQVLQSLASAGHEDLAVDIAVRGRCAECAHPSEGGA